MLNKSKRKVALMLILMLLLTGIPYLSFAESIIEGNYDPAKPLPTNLTSNKLENFVQIALSQKGYTEKTYTFEQIGTNKKISYRYEDNHTIYNAWYYNSDISAPWCANFVSWCAGQAGILDTYVPKHEGCLNGQEFFEGQGRWRNARKDNKFYLPQRGDLVYFDFGSGVNKHVGIVTSYSWDENGALKIHTIEGNTSSGMSGSQDNGEGVYERTRTPDQILGYGTLNAPSEKYASKEPFTITFDANGGQNAPAPQIKERGDILKLVSNVPDRKGYTILGWSTSPVATSPQYHIQGDLFKIDADTTLYAVWTPIKYVLNYDLNYPNAPSFSEFQQKGYGQEFIVTSKPVPLREGHVFDKWATSKTISYPYPLVYKGGDKIPVDSNIKLYAIWTVNSYQVGYNLTGGTMPSCPVQVTKKYGEMVTTSVTKPTREGYDFINWAIIGSASGNILENRNPGEAFKLRMDTTVRAEWKKSTYPISYNANGGSGAPGTQVKTHGVILTLSAVVPTRAGHTFKGWARTKDAKTKEYSPSGSFAQNETMQLFAVWEPLSYTISYDANKGQNAPSSQSKKYNEKIKLRTEKPARKGFTFMGWATSSTATKANYQPAGLYEQNANLKLYAVWAQQYGITYNANGGTGAPGAQVKTHGVALTLSAISPTRTGYTFKGWARTKDAKTREYSAGGAFTRNEALQLFAVWDANIYKITYHANGGTGAPSIQNKTHGKDITISSVKPTRVGYTFQGWALNANVTKTDYSAGGQFKQDKATTLYAVWKINTYILTYEMNNGTGAKITESLPHGGYWKVKSPFGQRIGYKFHCWVANTGRVFYSGETMPATMSYTLKAEWIKETYTIKYDANGGKNAPEAQVKTFDLTLKLSTVKPTRAGYTFMGWSSYSNSTTAYYVAGGNYTENSNKTLYAVWKRNTSGMQYV